MKTLLIGASDFSNKNNLEKKLLDYDYIIAVDGGVLNAEKLGLKYQLAVGDFDSFSNYEVLDNIKKFSCEKDETDMLLAVDIAIEKGSKELDIICGTGKRFDHTFANVQLLDYINSKNVVGRLLDEYNIITVIYNENLRLNPILNSYISFFSLQDDTVITLSNLKYEVIDYNLKTQDIIGVSNEFLKGKIASIDIKGKVLMIISEKH
ncbi:MAG: thiamine diphosphokinase [Oscillospiraceae bacterium]